MTAVLAGSVVTPTGIVDDGVVEVRDGTLGYVGPRSGWTGRPPDAVGLLVPGFVDIHCHGGGGHAVTSTDPAEISAVADHHAAHGTTSMLAGLISAPTDTITAQIDSVAGVIERGDTSIVGIFLEGPWISHERRGAHDPSALALPDADVARTWLDAGRGTVRMVTIAPELPGAAAVSRLLEEAQVLAAHGHTDADAATLTAALRARRAPVVTHLFNGMAPLHHRAPGAAGAALRELARGGVTVELIADGVHVADETAALVFEVDRGGHVVLVSDAMNAAGLSDGDYRLGSLSITVTEGVARIASGSIAGGTSHLADQVRRCVTLAGLDPVAVVAAASSTPAALLGLSDRGSLAPGLRADLVALDDDWRVTRVMRGGAWVD